LKLLALALYNNTVKVWDAATDTLQQTLKGHSNAVNSVAFSHDSKLLALTSDDNTVKVWDVAISTL
jgi:WD40 repeat protein